MTVSAFLHQLALEYRTLADQIRFEALRSPLLLHMVREWEEVADRREADLHHED